MSESESENETGGGIAEYLREHSVTVGVVLVLVVLAGFGIKWIVANHESPPPRKVTELRVVNVRPQPPPPKPPTPPPQVTPPKVVEQTNRVEVKATDIPPPDAPRPASAPAGGHLALAAEGQGPGDSFNLQGNPGGRGLLSGGGLGDGDGLGQGDGAGSRFGWYSAKVAAAIEDAFRKKKQLSSASTRVEFRVWTEQSGHIRIQLVQSTGDAKLDDTIQSVASGLVLREPPPADIPLPMVLRLTVRRPG